MQSLKHRLLVKCHEYVESRIATATQALADAQRGANEESKSSAGDKYETGRAMMQIEGEQAARQLAESLKLKNILDRISPGLKSDRVVHGSIVITNNKKIFISIGIGKVVVDDENFLVVASASPLGTALMGLSRNDKIIFNNESITILEII
jgi:transcription elongation GreA/GreB family factor